MEQTDKDKQYSYYSFRKREYHSVADRPSNRRINIEILGRWNINGADCCGCFRAAIYSMFP